MTRPQGNWSNRPQGPVMWLETAWKIEESATGTCDLCGEPAVYRAYRFPGDKPRLVELRLCAMDAVEFAVDNDVALPVDDQP